MFVYARFTRLSRYITGNRKKIDNLSFPQIKNLFREVFVLRGKGRTIVNPRR